MHCSNSTDVKKMSYTWNVGQKNWWNREAFLLGLKFLNADINLANLLNQNSINTCLK